jgi:hypothetical protein
LRKSGAVTLMAAQVFVNGLGNIHLSSRPEAEGDDSLYVSVTGQAELIRDKAQFEKHGVPDLEQGFGQGTDTPGMVLLCVKAKPAGYWQEMAMEWRWRWGSGGRRASMVQIAPFALSYRRVSPNGCGPDRTVLSPRRFRPQFWGGVPKMASVGLVVGDMGF